VGLARSDILGGWELVSFTAHDVATGRVSYPLAERPSGLIMYIDDGYMSAQLTSGRPGHPPLDPVEESRDPDYVAYGGCFVVDGASATVHHQVLVSMLPALFAQPQLRHATVEADCLTLSATAAGEDGAATHSTLVWRRVLRGSTRSLIRGRRR